MSSNFNCDICGRSAKHHQTSIDGRDVAVRHLCGLHARSSSLSELKDILTTLVDELPDNWMTSQGSKTHQRQQVTEAGSLRELAGIFQMQEIAKSFRPRQDG